MPPRSARPDPYAQRGKPRPVEDTQRVWRSLGWEQPTLFPITDDLTKETEVSGRMWTIKPSDEQLFRMKENLDSIKWAVKRMREFPPEQSEISVIGLERLLNDMEMLHTMNTRLMVCYAVEAGIMSEGQGAKYLGLDRVTFREIKSAAHLWAERAEKGRNEQNAPLAGAAGGSPGESTPEGMAGPG